MMITYHNIRSLLIKIILLILPPGSYRLIKKKKKREGILGYGRSTIFDSDITNLTAYRVTK